MDSRALSEIDITRQARALGWLRMTDYLMVVVCGLIAFELLSAILTSFSGLGLLLFQLLGLAVLSYAAYTGWRHVGVINPAVWKRYRFLFPLLAFAGAAFFLILLAASGSLMAILNKERTTAEEEIAALSGAGYIFFVSLIGWFCIRRLKRSVIAGTGDTIEQLTSRLNRQAGPDAHRGIKIPAINKRRGVLLCVAGLLVLIIDLLPTSSNPDLANAQLRLGQNLIVLSFFLLIRARRYFQADAEALLAIDHRPPILFLRSFEDDEKQTYSSSQRALLDFSLELRLSNHFSRFGPFIAIGSPKDKLPQLGAARAFFSNDEWQSKVLAWMRESQLIIMYSGKTQWVNWELRQLIQNGCITRLILLMPEIKFFRSWKRSGEVFARAALIRSVFEKTPWESALPQFDDFRFLRAVVFRPDGSTLMIKCRSRQRDSYHLAALIAHSALLDTEPLQQAVPAAAPVMAMAGLAPVAQAPVAQIERGPAAAPVPVQTHAWKYIVATALATVAVCVLGLYAFVHHINAGATAASAPAAARSAPADVPVVPASASQAQDPAPVLTKSADPIPRRDAQPAAATTPAPATVVHIPERASRVSAASAPPPRDSAPETSQTTLSPASATAAPPDPSAVLLQNAQAAANAGHLIAPQNDCALFWALALEQAGNPQGAAMERTILTTVGQQIDSARAAKNYDVAIGDVDRLMVFYPGRAQLLNLRAQILAEQQQQLLQSQLKQFVLQHRHMLFANNGQLAQAYCTGVLTIAPDGSARYDCTASFDPQGRCDHVLFPTGAIKEVRFLRNGLLHFTTDHLGNFDFYGAAGDLQAVYQNIGALARR
jgi:hypothetical protein